MHPITPCDGATPERKAADLFVGDCRGVQRRDPSVVIGRGHFDDIEPDDRQGLDVAQDLQELEGAQSPGDRCAGPWSVRRIEAVNIDRNVAGPPIRDAGDRPGQARRRLGIHLLVVENGDASGIIDPGANANLHRVLRHDKSLIDGPREHCAVVEFDRFVESIGRMPSIGVGIEVHKREGAITTGMCLE